MTPPTPAWHQRILRSELTPGLLLMATAALAIVLANSPLAGTYFAALHIKLGPLSLHHWINDGLMALFFLVIGLEVKREFMVGQMSSWSARVLPGLAALGGMAVPALIYAATNLLMPGHLQGWAIPAATDVAFALAVLSFFSKSIPVALKVFLMAIAVIDDLGAVLMIALFYSSDIDLTFLAAAAAVLTGMVTMNRLRISHLLPYLILGTILWVFVLQSGLHATLAGVLIAMTVPLHSTPEGHSPLLRLEHKVAPLVAFFVVPLFGFANAGVSLGGMTVETLIDPVPLGVAAGLLLGKQVGVFGMVILAVRTGLAKLPGGASWSQVYAVSLLCGIGFTMSLFIGTLAFPASPLLQDEVKIGVLVGSLFSGLLGAAALAYATRPSRQLAAVRS